MSRAKKKHVCSCGEEFNHGIGLRKHQRQTGHKGSSIVDDDGSGGGGDEEGEGEAAASPSPPPPAPAPPPPPPPPPVAKAPEPAPPPPPPPKAAEPPPRAAAQPPPEEEFDEPDRTVPVARAAARPVESEQPQQQAWPLEYGEGPSRFQHNRQKLSLVSRGLRVLVSYRARSAGDQLKRSARSGADIFAEAFKIALALLLLIAIPAGVLWWWVTQRKDTPPPVDVPNTFTFDQGAPAARSAVLQYLDGLSKQRWNEAYDKLSSDWKQHLDPAAFQQAFTGISDVRWRIDDQKLLPGGDAEVRLLLAYQEDGRARKFQGRFRLVQQGQVWKLDRLELTNAGS